MPNDNHDDRGRFSAGRGNGPNNRNAGMGLHNSGKMAESIRNSVESHQQVHQELHDKTVAQPLANAASQYSDVPRPGQIRSDREKYQNLREFGYDHQRAADLLARHNQGG